MIMMISFISGQVIKASDKTKVTKIAYNEKKRKENNDGLPSDNSN